MHMDKTADPILIAPEDPDSAAARHCLSSFFAELAERFEGGFDPGPGPHGAVFRAAGACFLIARRGGQPLGCVGLVPLPDGNATAEVKRLWIAPEIRGQGLATRLMAEVESLARKEGFRRLVLDTNGTLTEAVAFYQRAGWTAIARYNDNPYAQHWFARDLA
jgi:GNAT superfamily N-acetyltransferase